MFPFRAGNKKIKKSLFREIYDTPEYVYLGKVDIDSIFIYTKLDSEDVNSSNFEETS